MSVLLSFYLSFYIEHFKKFGHPWLDKNGKNDGSNAADDDDDDGDEEMKQVVDNGPSAGASQVLAKEEELKAKFKKDLDEQKNLLKEQTRAQMDQMLEVRFIR